MLALNLALAFGLELVALTALGVWGYSLSSNPFLRVLVALGLPLLLAILWGTFLSPKAAVPLPPPLTLLTKLLVFGIAAFAFWVSGYPLVALVFAVFALLNTFYLYIVSKPSVS